MHNSEKENLKNVTRDVHQKFWSAPGPQERSCRGAVKSLNTALDASICAIPVTRAVVLHERVCYSQQLLVADTVATVA